MPHSSKNISSVASSGSPSLIFFALVRPWLMNVLSATVFHVVSMRPLMLDEDGSDLPGAICTAAENVFTPMVSGSARRLPRGIAHPAEVGAEQVGGWGKSSEGVGCPHSAQVARRTRSSSPAPERVMARAQRHSVSAASAKHRHWQAGSVAALSSLHRFQD